MVGPFGQGEYVSRAEYEDKSRYGKIEPFEPFLIGNVFGKPEQKRAEGKSDEQSGKHAAVDIECVIPCYIQGRSDNENISRVDRLSSEFIDEVIEYAESHKDTVCDKKALLHFVCYHIKYQKDAEYQQQVDDDPVHGLLPEVEFHHEFTHGICQAYACSDKRDVEEIVQIPVYLSPLKAGKEYHDERCSEYEYQPFFRDICACGSRMDIPGNIGEKNYSEYQITGQPEKE